MFSMFLITSNESRMLAILIPKVYYTYLSIDVFNMRSFIRAAVAKYIAGKEVSCKGNITLPSK